MLPFHGLLLLLLFWYLLLFSKRACPFFNYRLNEDILLFGTIDKLKNIWYMGNPGNELQVVGTVII